MQDALSMMMTFCPVLNGLKQAHLRRPVIEVTDPQVTVLRPGLARKEQHPSQQVQMGRKCSQKVLSPWHGGHVS